MAWRSSGQSNDELVDNLSRHGIIKSDRVKSAMKGVDRGNYVKSGAYFDSPQPIGHSATISAPHMHAQALELLEPFLKPGMRALDVGSGSGYLTACMALMVNVLGQEGAHHNSGVVAGIDYLKPLVDFSINNVQADHPALLQSPNFELSVGDGWQGCKERAPFDAIHVGASAIKIPDALVEQLASPGRMVIPVGPAGGFQEFIQVDKAADGTVSHHTLFGVSYVPLVKP